MEGGGRDGRDGRGVDTFARWHHLLGISKNYNVFIIPFCAFKIASPFKGSHAHSSKYPPKRGGKGMEWEGKEEETKGKEKGKERKEKGRERKEKEGE